MKKIFTFLVAFLTTVSGAVWGQTGSGTEEDPWIVNVGSPQEIGSGLYPAVEIEGDAIRLHAGGPTITDAPRYYKITGETTSNHIDINIYSVELGEDEIYLILDDVNITASNPIWVQNPSEARSEMHVHIILEGENRLTSTNNSPAILIGNNTNLDIKGSGALYATGSVGIGNDNGIVGDITITGGTIVARGQSGAGFGGTRNDGTNLTINGNTLVISAGAEGIGQMQENLRKGIYYDSTSDYNNAMVHGDVTLDSQFPSSEELQDILGGDLGIDFAADGKLTLGEGVYFNAAKLVNPDANESKLTAYHVTYSKPNITNVSVSGEAPAAIYCGPNTPLSETQMSASASEGTTYKFLGWTRTDEESKGTFVAASSNSTLATNSGVKDFPVSATFILKQYSLDIVTGTPLAEGFEIVYPNTAKVTIADAMSDPRLAAIGAKLADDAKGVEPGEDATITKDDGYNTVTLKASYTDGANASKTEDVVLNLTIDDTKVAITDGTLTFGPEKDTKVYDGQPANPTVWKITIDGRPKPITPGGGLTLKFKAKDSDEYMTSNPVDVGTYYAYVVAEEGEDATYTGTSAAAEYTITPKGVEIESIEDEKYDIVEGPAVDYSDNKITYKKDKGIIEGDVVTIATSSTGPADTDYLTIPGTYTVSYTLTPSGADAGNYDIPKTFNGKLIVTKTGGGEGGEEIKPGDPDDDDTEIIPGTDTDQDGWEWVAGNNRYERTYDGKPHPLSTISLKYKNEEGKTAWEILSLDEKDFSVTYSPNTPEDVVEAGYTATITITGSEYYSGTATMTLYINPRPMVIDINKLTAEDVAGITAATEITISEADVDFENFNAEKGSGIVAEEEKDAKVSGKITVTPAESTEEDKKAYEITVEEDDFTLSGVEGGEFTATNYKATYTYNGKSIDGEAITETIDDITPGEDTDIDDGNDDEDNNWTWDAEANAYILIYDGNKHGIESITVSGAEATEIKVTYSDEEGVELGKDELPLDAGHYTAEVIVTVEGTSKTGTIPLWIKQRPLGVHFNLDDYILEAGGEYDAIDVAEYEPVEVEENVWVGGELKSEEPVLEGTIKVADTPNSKDKYAVTFEGVKLGTDEDFDAENYEPTYYLNGELLKLDGNGDKMVGGENDPEQGIDISEPDDETGISSIGTKRYRLYLANKDYNVVDAKADYAAEGLELFSRHDKKYTKVGGSFTVWYEKDGVANAGGYRIFWSNRANGEYKEVKFDTVSEYFQIRNVQSDVYVKIYAADGFPVGNEEISAADYRAYAQPNKIVVITPQPTDVQIISMAGAVVATDKVTGQRDEPHGRRLHCPHGRDSR